LARCRRAGCSGPPTRPPPPASRSGSAGVPSTPAGPPPHLALSDCTKLIKPQISQQPGGDRDLSFSCGRMAVPVDHGRPNGPTLQMFVLRARLAGQSNRIGSLVINPAGPGGSRGGAAGGLALRLPAELLRRFDLVGFDPRGVGLSDPVTCLPAELKDRSTAADPDARTPAEYGAQVALSREAADACYRKYGARLGAFNTTDTARDLELLRRALGDRKL